MSGEKDPFGSPAEFADPVPLIPAPVTHVWLEGAGHDPKRKEAEIAAIVRDWIRSF